MKQPFSKYFDHTLLKPEATTRDIETLCQEAKEYGFYSVCINSFYVESAKKFLEGSDVKIACVVGFPLGASLSEIKAAEAACACERGACEIDMVMNIGAMKEGRLDDVRADIEAVVKAASQYGGRVKVILETCLLTREEIALACRLAKEAKAAFVKTSTGFSKEGARESDVALMKQWAGEDMQVKASGGIRDYETALKMIQAGADRIGASATVQIIKEWKSRF